MTEEERTSAVALLSRVPMFAGCRRPELEQLALSACAMQFEPADVLCEEGTESPECYVLVEGEALVTRGGKVVALRGPNQVVGERGPIEGEPRMATVLARTTLRAYAIPRETLVGLMQHSPAVAAGIRTELRRRYG
ncbi:MAG: cyclic nucleotide-binding domain-containing protein [Actinomycetota bacterium]